jgi:hypothetical protein
LGWGAIVALLIKSAAEFVNIIVRCSSLRFGFGRGIQQSVEFEISRYIYGEKSEINFDVRRFLYVQQRGIIGIF